MKKSLIKNYAKLIARVGGNIQKGQEVFITAETDRPDFIVLLAEECYKAGAANVHVQNCAKPIRKGTLYEPGCCKAKKKEEGPHLRP